MEESIQVFFPHLNWTERTIPCAALPFAGDRLDILHDHIREWKDGQKVLNHTRFGFPSTTCGWWDTALASEPIIKSLGPAPFARPPCSSHSSSRLDCILYVIRGLKHQVEDGLLGTNHTQALKLTPWIDAHHKRLVSRFLFVAQLDVEEPQFIPLWSDRRTVSLVPTTLKPSNLLPGSTPTTSGWLAGSCS